jgi:hypothetical protein
MVSGEQIDTRYVPRSVTLRMDRMQYYVDSPLGIGRASEVPKSTAITGCSHHKAGSPCQALPGSEYSCGSTAKQQDSTTADLRKTTWCCKRRLLNPHTPAPPSFPLAHGHTPPDDQDLPIHNDPAEDVTRKGIGGLWHNCCWAVWCPAPPSQILPVPCPKRPCVPVPAP